MSNSAEFELSFAAPTTRDGKAVADLVRAAGSLEPNTTYAYLLLCTHFASSCVVAKCGERIVGALLAYPLPAEPDTLFIWQIGTSPDVRGRGVARAMLTALWERARSNGARRLSATIAPSNQASWGLFRGWANKNQLSMKEETGFSREDFGGEDHEPETLLTIGPF